MKNTFSLMAGGTAGLGTIAAVTQANAVGASEALGAYMNFGMPAMVMAMATIITAPMVWQDYKKGKGLIEPKRLVASFAAAAALSAGVAYMADLPLTPHAANETRTPLTGTCYDARIRDGQLILPQGCVLGR